MFLLFAAQVPCGTALCSHEGAITEGAKRSFTCRGTTLLNSAAHWRCQEQACRTEGTTSLAQPAEGTTDQH